VPSLTFIASINAIRYVGGIPVFWDSAEHHWNADPALLESLITPKTRAIMAFHLYGDAMEMGTVLDVAKRHGLPIIEDAAEALGAAWQGQPCGIIGDIGCFSFNGNKTLTTGGGGLIVSRDPELMARAHYLINQAKDDSITFTHNEIGYNYRLTNLQAALGVAQLESLPDFLEKRRQIWQRYDDAFANDNRLTAPIQAPDTRRSCWLYGTALNEKILPERVAMDMVRALDKLGIQSRPFFKPGHLQKPFLPFVRQDLPSASHWHRRGFNLPSSCTLSESDQEQVIAAVKQTLDGWAHG
jgi:perosamine synthetase